MTRTILITGGAGFIGSNFCLYWRKHFPEDRLVVLDKLTYAADPSNLKSLGIRLKEKKNHISLSTPLFRFEQGDIKDINAVSKIFQSEDIDIVFHLAAESHVDRSIKDPGVFLDTNVKGTFVLLQACLTAWKRNEGKDKKTRKPRFIHVSTDEVFGSLNPGDAPFTELSPYRPNSPYAASKAASDHLVRAYNRTYGLSTVITNCSNNYGPFQYKEKLIPLMIHNIVQGKDLPVYGDGKNIRDWIHVTDHCSALLRAGLEGESGETYNIGADNEVRNIDLVQMLCDFTDRAMGRPEGESRKLISFVEDRAGHDRRYAVDSTKIRKKLKWKPEYNFTKGLEQTVEWYLQKTKHSY